MEETLRNGDKIELIAKKVGELFGNAKKMQYEKAVVVYASGTNPMFEIEEDERLKAIWEKTKQIVDNDRAQSIHPKHNEFTDLCKSLEEKRYDRLRNLSERMNIEYESLNDLPSDLLDFIEDEESCSDILAREPEWGSYEELFELVVTGYESGRANYLYNEANSYMEMLKQEGREATYDEMILKVVRSEARRDLSQYGRDEGDGDKCVRLFGRRFRDLPWIDLEDLLECHEAEQY